uniref:estradiol 17-beta-dehydrogenase 8-like n=1 Tax=Styela clava TaxID=7725 RepID=UPI001939B5B3|nr:estradiol 17-beta-dehydrogenase 8-like [Styela clava]
MNTGRLAGKAAIVTGGSSGIGQAICRVFAKEGASVAVLDIDKIGIEETVKYLPTKFGNKHCFIECDVSLSEDVAKAFKIAEENLNKKASILVNCAAILKSCFFNDIPEKDFDEIIKVNLTGVFLMSKKFIASMSNETNAGNRGSLINISSIAGIRGSFQAGSYCASKFAVVGLTKTIALEYPKHKVRCNAVLPGGIDTPMLAGSCENIGERFISQTPMQRLGKPEEVANACLFLASEESSYVNGACLEVTGGFRC